MRQLALPVDGLCCGPLFAPVVKVRPPKPRARGWRWYRARNAAATPPWVTPWKIDLIYAVARLQGATVDHIVPINHPLVCGLHVEQNLRIVSMTENIRKGNLHWPEMPERQTAFDFG